MSLFQSQDDEHYQRWINKIKEYVGSDNDEFIIKLSLSYTLQSLRAGESLKRFQWEFKES